MAAVNTTEDRVTPIMYITADLSMMSGLNQSFPK